MKENKDKHQVVMAREMYEDLMYLAKIGDNERNGNNKTVAKVRRHVQKYNKPIHVERQVQIHEEETEYRNLRNRVILLANTHRSELVWVKSEVPDFHGLGRRPVFYTAHKVVGRSEVGKLAVKLLMLPSEQLTDIHIKAIHTELPEGYTYTTEGMGRYVAFDPKVVELRKPYEIKRGN